MRASSCSARPTVAAVTRATTPSAESSTGPSTCSRQRSSGCSCGCRCSPRRSTSPPPRRSWPTTTCPPAASPTWWPVWPTGPCRPGHSGVGRYRMLETLRAFAAGRLPAAEAERLRGRHAGFMVDLAERAEAGLYGPDEPAWVRRVEAWLDDLRAAWSWARDAGEVDVAVRLAAALTRFAYWRVRSDSLSWGTQAAAMVPAHPRLAVAHAAAAHAAWIDGRLDQARQLARRGVAVAGGPTAPAAAAPLEALGDAALLSGDPAAALEAYRGVAALAASG